jgi:mono/diheme cytochrome c family protein
MMSKENEQDLLLDHIYDGIRELDNKLPPWWLYLFYITIIWGLGYLIYYHVLGIGDSSYAEYMKELDPNWTAPPNTAGFSLEYRSPFYANTDLTPFRQLEDSIKAEAAEQLAAGVEKAEESTAGTMDFNQLILAAMRISKPEDLDKLKSAFPEIWKQFESQNPRSTSAAPPKPEESEVQIEPLTDRASLAEGKTIFETNCATCHGKNGEGGIGPNLTDDYYLHGKGMTNTVHTITNGVPVKGMISWRGILKEDQIKKVASYILTLYGSNPPNAKAPQGEKIESMN